MKTILLISGKRTTGKDTVCEIIKEISKVKFDSIAFAYATKMGYCKDNNLDLNRMLNDYEYKESHRKGLLQYYLTHHDPLFYSDYVLEYINSETKNDINNFIIPDLRIREHADVFKSLDPTRYRCIFIRINASDETKISRGWIRKECDDNITETGLDNYDGFDIIINNDGTRDELKIEIYNHVLSHI